MEHGLRKFFRKKKAERTGDARQSSAQGDEFTVIYSHGRLPLVRSSQGPAMGFKKFKPSLVEDLEF